MLEKNFSWRYNGFILRFLCEFLFSPFIDEFFNWLWLAYNRNGTQIQWFRFHLLSSQIFQTHSSQNIHAMKMIRTQPKFHSWLDWRTTKESWNQHVNSIYSIWLEFFTHQNEYSVCAAIFSLPGLFDDFSSNHETALPIALNYDHHHPTVQSKITDQIREFYFNKQTPLAHMKTNITNVSNRSRHLKIPDAQSIDLYSFSPTAGFWKAWISICRNV